VTKAKWSLGGVRRRYFLNHRLKAILFASCWLSSKNQTSAIYGPVICRCPGEGRCKLPLAKDEQKANTLASSKARIFGHDYGLERSSNCYLQWPRLDRFI